MRGTLLALEFKLGESLTWDFNDGCIYVVDIPVLDSNIAIINKNNKWKKSVCS